MATEAEFRSAAASFDASAESLRAEFSSLDDAWSGGVITGGRLALTVERTLDATHTNTMMVVTELHQLADECRRRAAICAGYAADMATYRRRLAEYRRAVRAWEDDPMGSAPWPPTRPARPAPWCEEPVSVAGWR